MWQAVATESAATMTVIYSRKIHTVLKNPAGRQKIAPVAVVAAAISICRSPWSRLKDMEPSMGAAMASPIAQEIDVHCKGEYL